MTIEAQYLSGGKTIDWTADAAVVAGQVIQLRDGRAGVIAEDAASGTIVGVYVDGLFLVQKTASVVILMGSRLFWDHSANVAHLIHVNDRDFYLGTAQGGGPTNIATVSAGVTGPTIAASAAGSSVVVALNGKACNEMSLASGFASVPINTAGFPFVQGVGDGANLGFSATAEAQKVDALSHRGMSIGSLSIVDALICVNTNGDASAVDINIGLANGTHATDADSITESLFVHIDGASTNINMESDDGTTEVAATDTTVDFTAGTPFLVQWDLSNNADIQAYINGVNVLPSSVFKLNAATGPLKLLAHMEKTSDDSPGNVSVLSLVARTAQV